MDHFAEALARLGKQHGEMTVKQFMAEFMPKDDAEEEAEGEMPGKPRADLNDDEAAELERMSA